MMCNQCRFYAANPELWRGTCTISLPPMLERLFASAGGHRNTFTRGDSGCDLGKKKKAEKTNEA